jgi:NodT family efflux transporter outer membrane factor (OMF) lipoprotein
LARPTERFALKGIMKKSIELPHPARLAWIATLALGLGCAVGPRFTPPGPPGTEQYGAAPLPPGTASAQGVAQSFVPGGPVPEQWWTGFGSPELNDRVGQALQHSPTVAMARAALTRAQENLRAANGGRWPAVDLQGGINRENTGPSGAVVSPYTVTNASVTVAYTLDLFGAVRRGIEFQQSLAEQQRWLLQGANLTLAANVATTSIREAGLRAQVRAQEAVLDLFREQETLIRKQVDLGAKGPADLLSAQANVASAEAQLPGLRQQLAALRNQLYVYLGWFPAEGGLGALELEALTLPRELPVSLPSTLVRRRPDVMAAEAQLHGATAQLGLAQANLFPSLTLSGSYGVQAAQGSPSMTVWNAGLNLLQPVFNGGSLRARKRAAAAGLDEAVAGYRSAVLNAFGNVADSLNALQADADTLQAQARAERAAASSRALAETQYRLGAASYLQVLDATRLWQQARTGLIQAQATRLADTAALYAALGGGWTSQQQ